MNMPLGIQTQPQVLKLRPTLERRNDVFYQELTLEESREYYDHHDRGFRQTEGPPSNPLRHHQKMGQRERFRHPLKAIRIPPRIPVKKTLLDLGPDHKSGTTHVFDSFVDITPRTRIGIDPNLQDWLYRPDLTRESTKWEDAHDVKIKHGEFISRPYPKDRGEVREEAKLFY